MSKENEIPNKPLGFIWFSSKPFKKWIILSILAIIVASSLETVFAFIVKQIIDNATLVNTAGITESNSILFWVILFPVVILAEFIIYRLSGLTGSKWILESETFGYKKLFAYMSKHSQSFFDNRFAGSLVGSISISTSGVNSMINQFLWSYLTLFIEIILTFYLVFTASSSIAWIFIIWIIILIPLNYFLSKKQVKLSSMEAKNSTTLRGKAVDSITNITAIHQFSRRSSEILNINKFIELYRNSALKSWRYSELMLVLNNFLVFGFAASMAIPSFFLWQKGAISIGEFIMIITLVSRLVYSLTFIGHTINRFAKNYGEIKEGLSEILQPHDITDKKDARELKVDNASVRFDSVDFWYDKNTPILKELSLNVPAGQKVGIVGPSGAGKTTFIRSLLRQHDLKGGAILIDNQDIGIVTQDSLRSQLGIVPQEPMLFHRTIKENIQYGNMDATDEEIEEAAKLAQAHNFIKTLTNKYDTLVGERGVKLSAGQRQRIAIARALLKNAPVLILDEATSALDSESEVAIQTALTSLMKGKTVFAVAHRLSTLSEMDRILVMKDGYIIEDGNHEELIKKGGLYAKLWGHQAGGFITE